MWRSPSETAELVLSDLCYVLGCSSHSAIFRYFFAPGCVQITVLWSACLSVCLYVGLCTRISASGRISKTTCPNFTNFFCRPARYPWLLFGLALTTLQSAIQRALASLLTFRIRRVWFHSNETRASIANPRNRAQLGGTPYRSSKSHPGPCSTVGMRPFRRACERQTCTQTDGRRHNTFRLAVSSAKCSNHVGPLPL